MRLSAMHNHHWSHACVKSSICTHSHMAGMHRNVITFVAFLHVLQWMLMVEPVGGWGTSWRAPLIAVVVIAGLILTVLVFLVLLNR